MPQIMLNALPLDKMLWIDYVISFLVVVSALFGLIRGLVKEVFALLMWISAIGVGFYYCRDFAILFQSLSPLPPVQTMLAFAALFFSTLVLGGLIGFILNHMVEKTGLTFIDRILGMAFGFLRGAVLISLLVLSAGVTPAPEKSWWKQAVLIPPFQSFAIWLKDHFPPDLAGYIHFR
jgi:membrane protein required for colicin V production